MGQRKDLLISVIQNHLPSPLDLVNYDGLQYYVKREDLIHPLVSGNKFRKLLYNFEEYAKRDYNCIVSFGGAYSNHIHALAYACNVLNVPLILYLRGEEVSNPTISDIREYGAQLQFISRSEYRERDQPHFLEKIYAKHPGALIIPEGGSNEMATKGVQHMMEEIYNEMDSPLHICVAYGSGGTSMGMLQGMKEEDHLHIFPVLKISNIQEVVSRQVKSFGIKNKRYTIHGEYHFGGYAKTSPTLIQFINHYKSSTGIALDPIYTGKLFFGINDLMSKQIFSDSMIIGIHTGGLQGIRGYNQRFGDTIEV